ncbi:10672_t:CDS:2, partial [Ambispora leptoticha]
IEKLRRKIAKLEAIVNRTPQQEQDLKDKKQELAELEGQQQSGGGGDPGDPKKTNRTPWIIVSGELDLNLKSFKYTLLTDNKEEVIFYNNRSLVNFLDARCKVNIEKSPNGEYNLGKSIIDLERKIKRDQLLTPIEEQVRQGIGKLSYNLSNIPNELIQQQIINLEQRGYNRKEIADFYHRDERTIYRRINSTNSQEKQKRGRPRKIKEDVSEVLCSYIEKDDNDATLEELSDYLFQKIGQRFSVPTIFRVLKKKRISWKKADKQFSEQDEEKIKQFVKDNCQLLSLSSLYSLDECSFNLGAVPHHARAHKSKRAVVKRSDNVRIHHAVKALKDLGLSSIKELAKQKNIVLVYLPPYTPELNPTENCNSVIKNYYRKHKPRTEEELRKVIEEGIAELKKHDLRNFFKNNQKNTFAANNDYLSFTTEEEIGEIKSFENSVPQQPKPKKENNKFTSSLNVLKTVLLVGGIIGGLVLVIFVYPSKQVELAELKNKSEEWQVPFSTFRSLDAGC